MDTVVLAGGLNKGALKEYSSEKYEAFIKINNIPMVDYVIKAINEAEHTDKVVVVGPQHEIENLLTQPVDFIVDTEESMVKNLQKGIKKLNTKKHVLVITSDIPLINKEIIDEFIISCSNNEADIFYPIVSREVNKKNFPDIKRTYVHLTEGYFTGGNMVVINPEILNDALFWLEKAIFLRKKPWKLSRLLGIKFILKLFLGNLSILEIEKRVSEITGYLGKGMIIEHPEVGFDVDKPDDLKLIREKYISRELF